MGPHILTTTGGLDQTTRLLERRFGCVPAVDPDTENDADTYLYCTIDDAEVQVELRALSNEVDIYVEPTG